jgi:aminopeptidase N
MPSLTRAEAVSRAALLTVHDYSISIDVTTGPDTFRSTTVVRFAAAPESATFIEVRPVTLHRVLLNGAPVDVAALHDGRLPLTGLAAENELVVSGEFPYSHECAGLHRYVDPADGNVYLYAQSAPNDAPAWFACFDQPDLKAPFTFSVTTPVDWQVIGTGQGNQAGPGRWDLAPTPPLPTYLAAIIAGPYHSLTDFHSGITFGLYARASLASELKANAEEIFDITRRCLDEYLRLFGVDYPFGKYDQAFVPEFSNIAMENPAIVLIRDHQLYRGTATEREREDRAVTIAHEMSHMWFGNLVTMRWWDDLWLNEAFGDYMGHRVPAAVTSFRGTLTTFSALRKGLAYAADQRPSTHPLSADAPDVATGLSHFDHISYFKGSAVIRQLATLIGEEALQNGLRRYIKRHAYGNADYGDFLAALADSNQVDLPSWAQTWLRESNVDTLEPEIAVDGGRITAAAIVQSAPASHPVLRPHTLNVGLYGAAPAVVRVTVDGPRTELPELVGRPAPRFLLLNDDDLAYAKVRLHPQSLAALPAELPGLSSVNQAMIWCALLQEVRDAVLPAAQYLELVSRLLSPQTAVPILTEVLRQAQAEVIDRFLPPAHHAAALARLADLCRVILAGAEASDQSRLIVFRALIGASAETAELRNWLAGRDLPAAIAPDSELAWLIRFRLAQLGELSETEIRVAYDADRSIQGEQFLAKCQAARPDPAAKHAAWQAITTDPGRSNFSVWALAEGFWQPSQAGLTAPYVSRFFADLPGADRVRGDQVMPMLTQWLYPRYAASPDTLAHADALLGRGELSVPVRRKVVDSTDDLRRVVRALAAYPS